jgi:hypothetical protein
MHTEEIEYRNEIVNYYLYQELMDDLIPCRVRLPQADTSNMTKEAPQKNMHTEEIEYRNEIVNCYLYQELMDDLIQSFSEVKI